LSDTYFRFVRGEAATLDDFTSQGALGKIMRFAGGEEAQRRWNEGISVYDSFDYACRLAASSGFRMGSYIATLTLPIDHELEIHRRVGTDTITLSLQTQRPY
jgi:hypothetical protein